MIRRGALSATTTVADVLRWAAGRRESGGLHLDGPAPGAVYLVDGDISFVTSGRGMPMDQQLVASGVLTREQVPHVMAQVRAGRDLAFVLDAEPGVEYRGAVQLVHDRSVEALADLLDASSGTYLLDRYDQHPFGILGHWPVTSMLEIAQAIRIDGLDDRAASMLALVVEPIPATGEDTDVVLTPSELRLLLGANGGRTLQAVANSTGLSLVVATRLARELGERGLLRLVPAPVTDESAEAPHVAGGVPASDTSAVGAATAAASVLQAG